MLGSQSNVSLRVAEKEFPKECYWSDSRMKEDLIHLLSGTSQTQDRVLEDTESGVGRPNPTQRQHLRLISTENLLT